MVHRHDDVANAWFYLDIPETKSTTTVKFVWLKGQYGTNPGFWELEAYLAS